MFSQIKKITAAAALLAAAPVIASAQTVGFGSAPVSVTSFGVTAATDWDSVDRPVWFGSERFRSNENIAVDYVNRADVAATRVTFVVNDGERTQNVVANGTFAPGVAIARSFTTDGAPRIGKNPSLTVAQVRFADGRVWNAPAGIASNR